jgi:hypothetical protein
MLKGLSVLFILFLEVTALNASPTFDYHLTGVDGNGNTLSGTAIFTILDAHHFTVTLSNTSSMQGLEQLLEGLQFTLTAGGVAMITSSGDYVLVNADGSVTDLPSGTTSWGIEGSDSGWLVCAQCGSSDTQNILGGGPYAPSLAGTYLDGTVTFEVSTGSTIPTDGDNPFSNVSLVFGSGGGRTPRATVGGSGGGPGGSNPPGSGGPDGPPGTPGGPIVPLGPTLDSILPVPEPATFLFAGAALLAGVAVRRLHTRVR